MLLEGEAILGDESLMVPAFSAGANILESQTSSKFKLKSHSHTTSKTPVRVPGNPPITVLILDLTLGITISHFSHQLAYKIRTASREFDLGGLDYYREDKKGQK
ncbi:hypothetical protein VP01_3789g1 [Puccinia sorghi]|uniref:Uncharacterized protein n=1 Tax=Puccinia sorghi TaxID=27349 RepID=A0A0L6UTK2_9BASI|nr:hypothetical protein VP01_3789g1 [Puccinia sorghi]